MNDDIKIILIPLDNRPVCYSLPAQIGRLNNKIEVLTPPRELIGGLNNNTQIDEVLSWIESTLKNNKIDFIICSLDTIAYGGLIPSRRSKDNEIIIKNRLDHFKLIIKEHKKEHNIKLYAYSSIMRISNNNINEEEKGYWSEYGEFIFRHSYLVHRLNTLNLKEDGKELDKIIHKLPKKILDDYLSTRERNFFINKYYLEWVKDGFLDYMVYCQDDTAEWGYNVQEANSFRLDIRGGNLSAKAAVQAGADEIASGLLTRGLINKYNAKILIYPVFSTKNGKNIISRYEDRTILKSVQEQIALCGAKAVTHPGNADLMLLVHTPENSQNDHAMNIYSEPENKEAAEFCVNFIKNSQKHVMIADVAYANGADNLLAEKLLAENFDLNKIYGYSGWNTTGNTLGSVISTGISRYIAQKNNEFNSENFKKLILVRLADDWAYQTLVRQKIRALTKNTDEKLLQEKLTPYIACLAQKIGLLSDKANISFPWNRTFEIEINPQ